jgi:hypothetical protein
MTPLAFEIVGDAERDPVSRQRVRYGPLFDALLAGKTVRIPFADGDANAIRAVWHVAHKGTGKHVHVKRNGDFFIAWADDAKGCAK